MAKGGGSAPTQQNVTTTTSNLPEYARPYFEDIMQRAQALSNRPVEETIYPGERIAGFTPEQQQIQQQYAGLQTPGQYGAATNMAALSGLGALKGFTPQQVEAQNYTAPEMRAAQTNYNPNLNYFQMETPQAFGQAQAQQYMNPYTQNVLDVQKREAITDAQKGQLAANLGAARQGTYGGSRQLLASLERERNLGQQLGDIQARGQQAAYENAQAQYERDRAARMGAQGQNLQAALGVQQLGTQTGLQTSLANLDARQQANVQNLASQLQTQGLNAQQAMQAALANQQAQMQAEQMRLQGLAQLNTSAQTLAGIGQGQQQSDLSRLQAQQQSAAQNQAMEQQRLDQQYADFLRQRDYEMEQLGYFSNLMRGVPVGLGSTQTVYGQSPSVASQIGGLGLGGLSLYNLTKGG